MISIVQSRLKDCLHPVVPSSALTQLLCSLNSYSWNNLTVLRTLAHIGDQTLVNCWTACYHGECHPAIPACPVQSLIQNQRTGACVCIGCLINHIFITFDKLYLKKTLRTHFQNCSQLLPYPSWLREGLTSSENLSLLSEF